MKGKEAHESIEVYSNDVPIGRILRVSDGLRTEYRFLYANGRVAEDNVASLSMPVVKPDYGPYSDLPYPFQVSLPEGWVAQQIKERFGKGVRLSDSFSMLRLIGRNPIGRLTFAGKRSAATIDEQLLAAAMGHGRADWLKDVLKSASPENFSISGVVPKMLTQGAPRSATFRFGEYILKLESPSQPFMPMAEDFALSISRRIGIPTVNALRSDTGDALLIKRFDIDEHGSRLGFEDACALTGFSPSFKYDGCIEKIFVMIEHFVTEECIEEDKKTLLRIVLLNDILRNGDAHLKNFGLVYRSLEDVRLAPSYDILDTTLFIENDFPALTIRQYYPDEAQQHKRWMNRNDLDELLDAADLPAIDIHSLYREIQEAAMDAAEDYRSEVERDRRLDDDRREFSRRMIGRFERRLREEGPNPLGKTWKSPAIDSIDCGMRG